MTNGRCCQTRWRAAARAAARSGGGPGHDACLYSSGTGEAAESLEFMLPILTTRPRLKSYSLKPVRRPTAWILRKENAKGRKCRALVIPAK
jgi:hypothetical protein